MSAGWWLGLGLVVGGVALLWGLGRALRRLRDRHLAQALEAVRPRRVRRVEAGANFFGQRSRGLGQVRGNGVLLLLDDALWFELWLPRRRLEISLGRLTGVRAVRSFLGKSRGVLLLEVEFLGQDGQGDAAAWYVRDRDAWLDDLRAALTPPP